MSYAVAHDLDNLTDARPVIVVSNDPDDVVARFKARGKAVRLVSLASLDTPSAIALFQGLRSPRLPGGPCAAFLPDPGRDNPRALVLSDIDKACWTTTAAVIQLALYHGVGRYRMPPSCQLVLIAPKGHRADLQLKWLAMERLQIVRLCDAMPAADERAAA